MDKKIDIEVLRKIRLAGCRYVILGIESASNKVLGLMRKGFTIEDIEARNNKEYSIVRQSSRHCKIPERMKKVGCYIPCFNAERTLAACLDAVLRQDYPLAEIVVVDDGSTDRTAQIAAGFPVRVLRHETNRGLAAARNTAFRAMSAEYIASLDADCMANPDWLSRLMRRFDHEEVCGAGGRLLDDRILSVFDFWRSVHMKQYWAPQEQQPGFLFGADTVFRRDAVLSVGLYNEAFKRNYEDVDLCRRLIRSGQKLVYEAGAVAHHWKEDNIFSLLDAYWNWRREYYQQQRFFDDWQGLNNKMNDNVGLANRYLEEDLVSGREQIVYLDFLLGIQHSVKDLEYFIFRDSGTNGAVLSPRLSPWLALTDLTFFYHYAGEQKVLGSLLHPKESLSQNFIALLLVLNRCLIDRFGAATFRRLLFKHLFFSVYHTNDHVLLEKLLDMVGAHPDWPGLLTKKHPYLNQPFLQLSGRIKQWLDDSRFQSLDVIRQLAASQEIVERDINNNKGA